MLLAALLAEAVDDADEPLVLDAVLEAVAELDDEEPLSSTVSLPHCVLRALMHWNWAEASVPVALMHASNQ